MSMENWRKSRGLSQDDVAARLGVRQAYYSRIEHGKANLTLDKIEKLAEILNVGVGEMVEELADARRSVLATLRDASDPGYLSRHVHRLSALLPHGSPLAA